MNANMDKHNFFRF